MTTHRAATWLVIWALALGPASAGCRSMQSVPVQTTATQPAKRGLAPGDHLRVTLVDGRRVRLTVKAVAPDAIVDANDARYPFADIRNVERRQLSGVLIYMAA